MAYTLDRASTFEWPSAFFTLGDRLWLQEAEWRLLGLLTLKLKLGIKNNMTARRRAHRSICCHTLTPGTHTRLAGVKLSGWSTLTFHCARAVSAKSINAARQQMETEAGSRDVSNAKLLKIEFDLEAYRNKTRVHQLVMSLTNGLSHSFSLTLQEGNRFCKMLSNLDVKV